MGKLGLEEFAVGSPLDNLPWPSPRNPWGVERTAGGSSSGSAVALAAGLVPLTLGTDTAGSVRAPAAYCGLVALKPTSRRLPADGVMPLVPTFDIVGPMARTADDCALLFEALAGPRPTVDTPAPKIGWVAADSKLPAVDADVLQAMAESRPVFERLASGIRDVDVPELRTYFQFGRIVFQFESYALHADRLRSSPDLYGAGCRGLLESGAGISRGEYQTALEQCALIGQQFDRIFETVDMLAMPVTLGAAARLDDPVDFARSSDVVYRMLANITGHPAIAFCTGFNAAGLPLSMQLVGGRGEDERLLDLVSAFQRQTRWHERRPPRLEPAA
jgi:aspartyl-tRNA(Asn)/glutamyl-tRNA(Gln) amidotransferase subunit A